MSKITTMISLLKTPQKMFYPFARNGFFKLIPDKLYLEILYYCEMGKKLDLKNPKSFSEKIQWLKLYDRNPKYIELVDKYKAKKLVGDLIGEDHIVKTIGVWGSLNDIDIEKLPSRFVLKCNHDSGGIVICKDKRSFDKKKAIKVLKKRFIRNAFYSGREWPYKNVKKRIIAEEYLEEDNGEDLIDYKFFCFAGVPKYCQVIRNRRIHEMIDFYDMDWNVQEFNGLGLGEGFPHGPSIPKPTNLEMMIDISSKLAKGTKFVRIDLYVVASKVFFGEFTLYPKSGLGEFNPKYWNNVLGDMIDL